MKIALYIEDGLEQIVLTPEGDTEEAILGKLHDGSRDLQILKGSFFDCKGGWKRHTPHQTYYSYSYTEVQGDESTMIVLRPAQRIEAGTDGTAQPVQPEGREPDGEADAPNPLKDRDHD